MNLAHKLDDIALELTNLTVIKASGKDAIGFLNDQFTNDIVALDSNHWQFNGYCNAKGRLFAIMRLFVDEDSVYFLLEKSLSETLIKRLQIYKFRAKVEFDTLTHFTIRYLSGQPAENLIGNLSPKQMIKDQNRFIINLSETANRCLLITPDDMPATDIGTSTCEHAEKLWRLSEIQAQVPSIFEQTTEKFVPQHVNLDQIQGISFTKGCFPGQEVVARLHYLGKSKQSMRQIQLESGKPLEPGESVIHPELNKKLTIVDAIETNDQIYTCLAVGQFD